MANRNTRRKAKQLAKEITKAHRDGMKVSPAVSRRRSKWKGSYQTWRMVSSVPGFKN